MKKRMLALLLCLGLLPLGGCAALLERGHVSSTVHVDYAVEEEDESILRAETYPGLVQSILYFVDGHRGGGTIRLYHYAGDVEADLAAAREAVLDTPAGAYAVGSLEFESTRILTYYEVKLTIRYTRTAREMEAIPEVTGLAGVRQELNRMVSEGGRSAAFLASYFTGDGAQVEQLLRLACCGGPGLYRHHQSIGFGGEQEHSAGISVSLYPETGARRIIEVKLDLPSAAKTDEDACTAQLDKAAFALLEEHPPAGDGYTVEELAAILRGVSGPWDSEGSCLAFDVLNGGGETVSDFALLMAMEHLCRRCGIAAEPVEGEQGLWLIVGTPQGSRHLLPESLRPLPPPEDGEEPPEPDFKLYTDRELTARGYEWATSLYPVCLGGESTQPPEPED